MISPKGSWARRRARRGGAVALLLAAALLTGCGGNGSGGDTGGGGAQGSVSVPHHKAPQPQVAVETSANGFDPAKIYREAAPGVVTIRSVFGTGATGSAAEGSGIVLNKDGEIVTNAHVVTDGEGSARAEADQVFIEFPDRNVVPADIIGFDPFADVALLKVNPDHLSLHPLTLGNDRTLVVGQGVAAIGSPFDQQQSLSVGVVSATDRSVQSLTQFQIEGAIQTDASINPGNSGGPLLDAGARVIGLNQQIETRSGANEGVGFAIPISSVKRSIDQLRKNGKAEYAYIGISSEPIYPELADKLGLDVNSGGLIATVVPGGPADKAGLRGGHGKIRFQAIPYTTGGDVVISVDGQKVVRPSDLARLISAHQPGDKVKVEILRDGERKEVEVTLGVRPTSLTGG